MSLNKLLRLNDRYELLIGEQRMRWLGTLRLSKRKDRIQTLIRTRDYEILGDPNIFLTYLNNQA